MAPRPHPALPELTRYARVDPIRGQFLTEITSLDSYRSVSLPEMLLPSPGKPFIELKEQLVERGFELRAPKRELALKSMSV